MYINVLLPGTEGQWGEEGEKIHKEAALLRWVFFCKSKRRLRRSPSPFPGPRARSARTKPFLTDIALMWSSKCPFVIPRLQALILVHMCCLPPLLISSLALSPCSMSRTKPSQTHLLQLMCVPFSGVIHVTNTPEQLAPVPEKSKTWERSLNALRLQIP